MESAGEGIDPSVSLADIFSGEIDFSTDVQPGDRFELLVEKQYRDDHVFAGYGPIVAAEFDNGGRRFRAVRFTPPGGAPGYYDERGVSMRRVFLHSPLKFEPGVTSGSSHGPACIRFSVRSGRISASTIARRSARRSSRSPTALSSRPA